MSITIACLVFILVLVLLIIPNENQSLNSLKVSFSGAPARAEERRAQLSPIS